MSKAERAHEKRVQRIWDTTFAAYFAASHMADPEAGSTVHASRARRAADDAMREGHHVLREMEARARA